MEATKEKKQQSLVKRIFKGIGKAIGIIFLLLLLAVVILTVRHQILKGKDRDKVKNAYGSYYVTENNDKINYTFFDSKSDKLAVLLPGYGCPSVRYEFDSFIKELNDDYKILVVEPLGYGLSDVTDTKRSVENYCSELHGLLSSLGYEKYTLMGHSISGMYALYYANTYTDEVEAFIGIDASVPAQTKMDTWIAKPKNISRVYKVLSFTVEKTGIYRFMTELSFKETRNSIPTLSDEELENYKALSVTVPMNKTQINEMECLDDTVNKTIDMKFPESVKVLYVFSKDNCDNMPEWEQIHKDLITNKDSKVVVISGAHYLHLTNLQGLVREIKGF